MGKGGEKWETLGTNGLGISAEVAGVLVMTEEPGIFLGVPRQGGMGEAGGLGEGVGRSTQIQRPPG